MEAEGEANNHFFELIMGSIKSRGRMNRAKQFATATAAIVPPPAPVQRPPAPSHTFYELDTRDTCDTLADKLTRAIGAFKDDIGRKVGPWAVIELGSDTVAHVAAAVRGGAKAQLAIVIGCQSGTQKISDPEHKKVEELALYQKNPGVEL